MTYDILLPLHTWVRWAALLALIITIVRAAWGFWQKRDFTQTDHLFRHWTATILHIQLIIGMLLYAKSGLVRLFWSNLGTSANNWQLSFFNLLHPALMLVAIVLITIGSALAKRRTSDEAAFKTIMIWYSIGLLIILLAIPWSFSPFVSRPNFRAF